MYDLSKILPHRPPMILLDDILEVNLEAHSLTSMFEVYPEKVFYEKKGINSLVGIEFMAQTIGCYAYFKSNCEDPSPGLLLGTRLYNNSIDYFKEGEKYTVTATEVFSDNDIVAFDCIIYNSDKEEVASATINAYQGKNVKGLLENE